MKLLNGRRYDLNLHLAVGYSFVALLALVLAISTALSDYRSKDRNDLAAYEAHYSCVSLSGWADCRGEIGRPVDFAYEFLVYISVKFLMVERFEVFLLLFSFFVYFCVLSFPLSISRYSFVPILFILSDFRFYELGGNVLRNGLALSLILLVVKYRLMGLIRLSPVFAHITSFPYFFYRLFQSSPYVVIFFLCMALYVSRLTGGIVEMFYVIPIPEFQAKVHAYFESASGEYVISKRYTFYFLVALFFYYFLKKDYWFLVSFGVFSSFFILHFVLSATEIGYRFVNYIVPFAAMVFSRIFDYLVLRYGKYAFIFLSAFLVFVSLVLFIK